MVAVVETPKNIMLSALDSVVCPACSTTDTDDLPIPHPTRSMVSDGRIIQKPLRKRSCKACGYGFHSVQLSSENLRDLYSEDYNLGQRDPQAEINRAKLYAHEIKTFLTESNIPPPKRFTEFGCGLGSLISILAKQWQSIEAVGIEPSPQLARSADLKSTKNVRVEYGFAEDFTRQYSQVNDLCFSVNVIEHALSPADFLQACKDVITDDGRIIVICPDGEKPSSELLFYDHISSFTLSSFNRFVSKVGLTICETRPLSGPLQGFRIYLLKKSSLLKVFSDDASALFENRLLYLNSWNKSKETLDRLFNKEPYAVFGTGEYVDLLRAYSPNWIENSFCFTVDNPLKKTHFGKPVLPLDKVIKDKPMNILAAVNERSWLTVKKRFTALGLKVYHPSFSTTERVT